MWGIGALLETMDRHKFNSYLNDHFNVFLDLPKSKDQVEATIFDYYISDEGME